MKRRIYIQNNVKIGNITINFGAGLVDLIALIISVASLVLAIVVL